MDLRIIDFDNAIIIFAFNLFDFQILLTLTFSLGAK